MGGFPRREESPLQRRTEGGNEAGQGDDCGGGIDGKLGLEVHDGFLLWFRLLGILKTERELALAVRRADHHLRGAPSDATASIKLATAVAVLP